MLIDNSVTGGMLRYVRHRMLNLKDRRKAYLVMICLVREFQRYYIPFGSFPAWEKSQEFHAMKAFH